MTSLSFDSKLKNWSGAQHVIIRVEPQCISMSSCSKKKMKGKVRWCSAAHLVFLITACFYHSIPWSSMGGIFWSVVHWFPSLIRGKPIPDPPHVYDNLGYPVFFHLPVISQLKRYIFIYFIFLLSFLQLYSSFPFHQLIFFPTF